MRFTLFLIAAFCVTVVTAAEGTATNTVRKLTPKEIAAKIREGNLRITGGRIRKPNSAKGKLVILNAQKTVQESELGRTLLFLDRLIKIQTAIVPTDKIDVATIAQKIAATGEKLGVALVETDGLPALLTAVENGWAIVNVKALAADHPAPDVLAKRTRIEIMRGFALIGGCASIARGAIVLRDVRSLDELDMLTNEDYGLEVIQRLNTQLPSLGITPWYEVTYKKACMEGWAPQPTNKYQSVIWDKVHAPPEKPLKIEFDPATQKGKVTK